MEDFKVKPKVEANRDIASALAKSLAEDAPLVVKVTKSFLQQCGVLNISDRDKSDYKSAGKTDLLIKPAEFTDFKAMIQRYLKL